MRKAYMKNLALLVSTILLLLLTNPLTGSAKENIHLMVNGNLLQSDVSPKVVNGRTLVPVRVIAESLGMKIKWNDDERKVTINNDQMSLQLTIQNRNAIVNGKVIPMELSPILDHGRTLVPLRFIGETLGLSVGWDALSRVALVNSPFSIKINDQSLLNTYKVFQIKEEPYVPLSKIKQPFSLKVDEEDHSAKVTITSGRGNSLKLDVVGSLDVSKRSAVRIDGTLFVPLSSLDELEIQSDLDVNQKMIQFNQEIRSPDSQPKYVIVMDPGHGGKDSGAKGIAGNYEKDFTLSLTNKVVNELNQYPEIEVKMTRTDDTYPTLQDRVDLANQTKGNLFLSIHANSFAPEARGTEVFYTHENSKEFAEIVYRHLLEATGFPDRGLKQSQFFVTRHTTMPAALIEVGFISNKMENTEMLKPEFQQRIAKSLADAIYEYYQNNR